MRRNLLFVLLFVVLIAALLFLTAQFAPGRSSGETATASATQTPEPLEADLTQWALMLTTSPTPSPTLPPEQIQATAEAYGTLHVDAIGILDAAFDAEGLLPQVTFSEEEINLLITPYLADVPNASNVRLDLVPGGARLTADLYVIAITVGVDAAADLTVKDGSLMVEVTDATVGGITPPGAALDAVNDTLIPMVNEALNTALAEYGPRDSIVVTAVETTDTTLIVTFRLLPVPPTPLVTPTPTFAPANKP